ncbi:MAG TPA: Uma2 family endonuclease [Geminicoccaceae bacterium]
MHDASERGVPGRLIVNLTSFLREELSDTTCRVTAVSSRVSLSPGVETPADVVVESAPKPGDEPAEEPAVVIEVVSAPGAKDNDTQDERWAFQALPSLKHLVYVAEDRARVEVATRQADGSWRSLFHERLDEVMRLDTLAVEMPLAAIYDGVELRADAAPSALSAHSEIPSEASTTPPNT